MQELINRAKELLADGTVARVLGWKAGGERRRLCGFRVQRILRSKLKQIYDRGFQTGR